MRMFRIASADRAMSSTGLYSPSIFTHGSRPEESAISVTSARARFCTSWSTVSIQSHARQSPPLCLRLLRSHDARQVCALFLARSAAVNGAGAELEFDAEELVVFCNSIRTAQAAGLDLPGVRGDGEIGDERVFRFAGAMADDALVAVLVGEVDRVERLGERS